MYELEISTRHLSEARKALEATSLPRTPYDNNLLADRLHNMLVLETARRIAAAEIIADLYLKVQCLEDELRDWDKK